MNRYQPRAQASASRKSGQVGFIDLSPQTRPGNKPGRPSLVMMADNNVPATVRDSALTAFPSSLIPTKMPREA